MHLCRIDQDWAACILEEKLAREPVQNPQADYDREHDEHCPHWREAVRRPRRWLLEETGPKFGTLDLADFEACDLGLIFHKVCGLCWVR